MLCIFYMFVVTGFISVQCEKDSSDSDDADLGNNLADTLKNDANLDLSVDDEYEDLRAEFLAYRTALASLASPEATRRSMASTACWQHNGICINYKLCKGFKFLTQVPGCRDKLKVCCFVWAKYDVRDHREFGLSNIALPWMGNHEVFGGSGVVIKNITSTQRPRKKSKKARNRALAYIIKT